MNELIALHGLFTLMRANTIPDQLAPSDAAAEEAAQYMNLPACPAVLTKLVRELRSEEPDFVKVAKLIGTDVSLAGEMLKTVNSPYYGLRAKVTSVHQALNVIGLRNAGQLVTGLMLREAFGGRGTTPGMQAYWHCTFKIALVNACLARGVGLADREEAYTFALFRDCGALAMMVNIPRYKPLPNDVQRDDIVEHENRTYGLNHATVGYYLTKSWFVPDHLCQAVLLHHAYRRVEGSIPQSSLRHIALAMASEWLYVEKISKASSPQWVHAREFVLDTLHISEQELIDTLERLPGC